MWKVLYPNPVDRHKQWKCMSVVNATYDAILEMLIDSWFFIVETFWWYGYGFLGCKYQRLGQLKHGYISNPVDRKKFVDAVFVQWILDWISVCVWCVYATHINGIAKKKKKIFVAGLNGRLHIAMHATAVLIWKSNYVVFAVGMISVYNEWHTALLCTYSLQHNAKFQCWHNNRMQLYILHTTSIDGVCHVYMWYFCFISNQAVIVCAIIGA